MARAAARFLHVGRPDPALDHVFGIYGDFGAFLVLRRSQIQTDAWQRTARSIGTFLVLNWMIGLTAKGISLSAHIGGVIVGFGIGAALLAGSHARR